MITYTKHTLQKIEDLLKEVGYTVRYEKGNFQSGYCLVENRKIAVVNKFFETEGRINSIMEIVDQIQINPQGLTEPSFKIFNEIAKRK